MNIQEKYFLFKSEIQRVLFGMKGVEITFTEKKLLNQWNKTNSSSLRDSYCYIKDKNVFIVSSIYLSNGDGYSSYI